MNYESTLATGYRNGIQPGLSGTPASTKVYNVPIMGVYQSTVAFANAAISSGAIAEITIASTSVDCMPGDQISAEIAWAAIPAAIYGGYRTSTAAASRLTLIVAVPGSSATATLSGSIRVTWLDLTP